MIKPEQHSLLKSCLLATVIAFLVLILFILPAEYNIDPTGFGSQLGLTQLAQQHQRDTPSTDKEPIKHSSLEQKTVLAAVRQDSVEVIVPAHQGIEYKFYLEKNQTMTYQWATNGAALYLDLHGEPDGDTTGYYESYSIATVKEMSGQFTTPFTGVHGWYWKNSTNKDVKVTLNSKGPYKVLGLK